MPFIGVAIALVGLSFTGTHPLAIAIVGVFGFICAMGYTPSCSCKKCAK